MREGAPQQKKDSSGPSARIEESEHRERVFALSMLREAQTLLKERMSEGGHTYDIAEKQESFSVAADAENFGPMLANVGALLAHENALADSRGRAYHLQIMVRGIHRVDVVISDARASSERK